LVAIVTGERSGLLTHIAVTESVTLCQCLKVSNESFERIRPGEKSSIATDVSGELAYRDGLNEMEITMANGSSFSMV
jgi:hypothetical protein